MKRAGFVLLICSLMGLGAQGIVTKPLLDDLRDRLFEIMKSEDQSRLYILQLEAYTDPVSRAYCGALNASMARHVFFPVKKWNYFVEGREQLELAVKESPASVEIRFLRLVIQSKAPSWLGYTSDVKEDLEFILARMEKDLPEERALLAMIAKNLIELEPLGNLKNEEMKTLLTKNALR